MTKQEIIDQINYLIKECNDIPLLDMILKLLEKSA